MCAQRYIIPLIFANKLSILHNLQFLGFQINFWLLILLNDLTIFF